ncbi:MAG TPA: cyclic pyranopterin monophosphate synthase MoaC [Smithellaceae bacterium]|nr:cyclic pyranopterin monophosphate synthase MoaC [Smithellaceae bacterium]
MSKLSHIDDQGRIRMVDVTGKDKTVREAVARGEIRMRPQTLSRIVSGSVTKGNVFVTAKIAGILAAKKTGDLIPLCHPLALTEVDLSFDPDQENSRVVIEARVRTVGPTGVEMEALTAVSVAALTIYDMCKAVEKEMTIGNIMLVKKSGGKSGRYIRKAD